MIRVFFALWPAASIQKSLYAVAKENKPKCGARLMRADTLHITLQFIGEIERSRLPHLIKAAGLISASPFDIVLDKLCYWKHNKIAYVAPEAEIPALSLLATNLKQTLKSEGISFENGKFSAHVTLMRHVEEVMASRSIAPIQWPIDHFALVESVTNQQGTHYRILQKWPLISTELHHSG